MFTALRKNGDRVSIEDAITGEVYSCPVCGNPVIVKAVESSSVRSHFAHKRNCLCLDNWKYDMSEWHFAWQMKFPIENREVVVRKDGFCHRADVLIDDTVIEFQHSPIQSEEFEARNSFYKKCGYRVVWLFDATGKMKIDDCFGLVWKRKNSLFSNMKTRIDALFVQHYLPGKNDILCISQVDPKQVINYRTAYPIMPENFLMEFGAIKDNGVLSIQAIFDETSKRAQLEQQQKKALEDYLKRASSNATFNRLTSYRNKSKRRL